MTGTMRANVNAAWGSRCKKDFRRNWFAYLMIIPVLVWYIVFCYLPMWGILISFQDFKPLKGFFGSSWVGFKHYIDFISGPYFIRLVRNTFLLNIWGLVFGFTAPILLAVLLNEVGSTVFKKVVQTVTYMPYFISLVVVCGILRIFVEPNGVITGFFAPFIGSANTSLLTYPELFRPIYTFSGIWQSMGWNSIIYLAAMASINPELYESAYLDGANRVQRIWHITLPSIMPTIVILLIFAIGGLMASGYEKIILLYNPLTYETADVIASYVYRRGLREASYSYSTAVGLMSTVVNFFFLAFANYMSKKYTETSIW
ncbi:MAG: ABC transporter permease subunit [Treponema sp.]|jgi:putative aldouronate transport system permease protein|nr:ABC transporter permease subunit [Treponema sp.]